MKKIIEKSVRGVAKGASEIGSSVIKTTLSALLADIAKDLISESGMQDIAKDKIIETGLGLVKSMNLDPKTLQKELLMTAIRKELGF